MFYRLFYLSPGLVGLGKVKGFVSIVSAFLQLLDQSPPI